MISIKTPPPSKRGDDNENLVVRQSTPGWVIPLLVLALGLAVASATYNFTNLRSEVDLHLDSDQKVTEDYHLFKQSTTLQLEMIRQKQEEMQKSQDQQIDILRKIARKQGIAVRDGEE